MLEAVSSTPVVKVVVSEKEKKQGRIHGYPSRVRVGRGSNGEGHWSIWAEAVSSKRSKTQKK